MSFPEQTFLCVNMYTHTYIYVCIYTYIYVLHIHILRLYGFKVLLRRAVRANVEGHAWTMRDLPQGSMFESLGLFGNEYKYIYIHTHKLKIKTYIYEYICTYVYIYIHIHTYIYI